jgi:HD-GYP domain-containing protein (c-di-GMP phosphodiesterase class II)
LTPSRPLTPSASPTAAALARRIEKLNAVLEVAKGLAFTRELDRLLPLIAREATRVVDADRCSIYLVDRERQEVWTKVAEGANREIRMPLTSGVAGAVVTSGQVINLSDPYEDPRFNREFDATTGYRTQNVLAVPMLDAEGQAVGVLQALNKHSGPFDEEDVEILTALAAQAAGPVENAILHEDISRLFEGFVRASVAAVESRDPTTAGHSERVAGLTVCFAQALVQVTDGPHAGASFTEAELREIRYASLLHDFGKVGVREHVLVKANKLHPHELEVLQMRFGLARKDRELASARRLAELYRRGGSGTEASAEKERGALEESLAELSQLWEFVLTCNRPTVLPQNGFERLAEVERLTFQDGEGREVPLFARTSLDSLRIPKGSLSELERREIESHVSHTFRFLSHIPWGRGLRRVPEIAHAHHERNDGSGYPRGLVAKDIPLQSRLMAITDVYDALTANDRPYKKAIPHEKALDILHAEARAEKLDAELLRIFIGARIPERAMGPEFRPRSM